MENLFTVGTFHFTTWNRLSSTLKFLREGTFEGFHAQFVDAPSYCRSFWTPWNTVGTLLVQRPCAEPWCVSAGLYALSTFGNGGRLACLEGIAFIFCQYQWHTSWTTQLLFSSEYLVHCSLVFLQVENTFEDFLTKLTSLWLLRPMLHSYVPGQVVFPHWLRAMWTAGHHPSYKWLQSGIAQSGHRKVATWQNLNWTDRHTLNGANPAIY